ncbi:MAG TPA: hypothetical protein VGJ02_08095 [Pyrinomonadaceae bacterium]
MLRSRIAGSISILIAIMTVVSVRADGKWTTPNIVPAGRSALNSNTQKTMTKHLKHARRLKRRSPSRSAPPTTVEIKRSGSWSGDVRDLPSTPPRKQERPQRSIPKIAPRSYIKPLDPNHE